LGVFKSLALARRPQSLPFERFIYTYTAIEGCFAIGRDTRNVTTAGGHASRTTNLCNALGIPPPPWLTNQVVVDVIKVRNATLHDGLFLQQPFGYASLHDLVVPQAERYMTNALAMSMLNLVCGFVVALLDIPAQNYLLLSTYDRNVSCLEL
jgi:hypothetical protein